MFLDRWVAALLAPLAIWVLLNGLDDLVIDLACLVRGLRSLFLGADPFPTAADLAAVPERRMAIFVPLWKEHRVIQHMVEHNIASQQYQHYDFFIGVYPNDPATQAAVAELVRRFPQTHLSTCPHNGPTSKADCLNWIYQRMLLHEQETGIRFEMILTHDAEDLVHPEALRWINYYAQWNDMVQIPVLALPTPALEMTHGVYCDEFAEFQFKDMPSRAQLGGFIPSNGVGTGFSRNALEKLAAAHQHRIFEPQCLTEDYENGFRIHRLGLPQKFVPIHRHAGHFIATREYFPRDFDKAVRQRSRWVTGIALQSWELHGFRETLAQFYWFWRDRKSLAANLITPFTNVLFLYGAGSWAIESAAHLPWGLAAAAHQPWLVSTYAATLSLQALHLSIRAWCSAQIYGWRFASAVPLRVLWGNWINFLATASAIRRYAWSRARGQPLVWLKTEHAYPNRAVLARHQPLEQKRKLGEILVSLGRITAAQLEQALMTQPDGMRLGDWLIKRGQLDLDYLYEALVMQQNIPLGKPEREQISIPITRALPAKVSREFSLLPFRVMSGHLYVAATELPDPRTTKRIRDFCPLDVRYHLVTAAEYEELAEEYLPV